MILSLTPYEGSQMPILWAQVLCPELLAVISLYSYSQYSYISLVIADFQWGLKSCTDVHWARPHKVYHLRLDAIPVSYISLMDVGLTHEPVLLFSGPQ